MPVLLIAIACLLGLSALTLVRRRHRHITTIVYGSCLAVALAVLAVALAAIGAAPAALILPIGLPQLGVHLQLDALAAVFVALIGLGAAGASLFALGYGRHEPEPFRVLPFYPAFLAGMILVVLAADAYSFLFAWELMSLASWALVMSGHRGTGTAGAGQVYLVMAGFGSFALLLAFGLLAGAAGSAPDGFAFATMRAHPPTPGVAAVALVLALLGAGSKAGLVPLHVWLPLAHPAAPSHVSALMSGVMTKVAVYAFLRLAFDLLGAPVWWWSLPVLILGGLTAVFGVLHGLMEVDLKRVLAYSTIENIGIVFIAIGLALAFKAGGVAGAAALALTAALFHALNHMLFKSVLFFGAGTLIQATGARSLEQFGGLIQRMPISAAAFLIASMAGSALPPFNGFASEWLILQSILVSPQVPQMGLKLLVPAIGVLLALAAALAAACFVRALGKTYLGRPRTDAAAAAVEADRWSVAAMMAGAGLCLLTGVFPGAVIDGLQPAAAALVAGRMPPQLGIAWLSIVPVSTSRSSYNGLLMLVFLASSGLLAAAAVHRFASKSVRRAPLWDCGTPVAGAIGQYSAAGLSQPIRRVFAPVVQAAPDQVDMPPPGDPRPARLRRFLHDPVWTFAYTPLIGAIGRAAGVINRMQYLTIRRYLSFVFATLILLLLVLALWG